MRRLNGQQQFLCILVNLLVWASLFGLSLSLTRPDQGNPLQESKNPALLTLWQVNESNSTLAQSATGIRSNRVLTKSPGKLESALYSCQHNIVSRYKEIAFLINSPNTVFKLIGVQVYQYLDIPPPHFST